MSLKISLALNLLSRKAIFLNSALCSVFHGRSRCWILHFGTAERLQAIWACEERCRTAWHWEALLKLSYSFVNHSSSPQSKPCISREIVSPCVTQHQLDADMSYVAFTDAWNMNVGGSPCYSCKLQVPLFYCIIFYNRNSKPVRYPCPYMQAYRTALNLLWTHWWCTATLWRWRSHAYCSVSIFKAPANGLRMTESAYASWLFYYFLYSYVV